MIRALRFSVSMFLSVLIFSALNGFTPTVSRGQQLEKKTPPTPGPMLSQGTEVLETPEFTLTLVRSSQTAAALTTRGSENFDFTPGDLLAERSKDGYYHLGDLDLRLRYGTTEDWKSYSTASSRTPVISLPTSSDSLASADLSPVFPPEMPLKIVRSWSVVDGKLALRFLLTNKSDAPIQVGSLGIAMIFNNILTDRSLEQAHARCVFYDPSISEDAGYLQVTRLSGHGPVLLVVPDGKTPLEAYNPILDVGKSEGLVPIFHDPMPHDVTFEGFYDWMVHSEAFAGNEWKNVQPWNPPTSLTIAPGASVTYGVRFLVSDTIRNIEKTLIANQHPVAVGVPGYILPMDQDARLFLKYPKPVSSIAVQPAGGIAITAGSATPGGWQSYSLRGQKWGRVRLSVTYGDGLQQTISYFVIKPETEAVADLGHFLTTKQWFVDSEDPFHRSPSVMSYDRETNQIVKQDSRVWIAGLGDEGGAGSWLAAGMKEFGQPNQEELAKYQQFVDGVLWGGLQIKDGLQKYAVRKSLFYYQPDQMPTNFYRSDIDWKSWTSWNKKDAARVDRSYDYPHVAAAYWVLYRLARNNSGLVTDHSWDWYLAQAYQTSVAMVDIAQGYAEFGQMEGDIFVLILDDLRREGRALEAANLESKMRTRAIHWQSQAFPYGSEMPWDSTGQEEVYAWMKRFGFQDKAVVTLNAILGYDPTVPHWGYNGSARRYWDFLYGGKYRRIERQLHHYGSGLNALPLLDAYRENPEDFYLLRVGYGGIMGALTDIDQEGFASAAFHSYPDMLRFDPLSGDYGPNFFGHALGTGTYIVRNPEFGWLAFGGNIKVAREKVEITPLDSFRTRIFLAPTGLWLTLDSGKFTALRYDPKTGAVRIGLAPATSFTPIARLHIEQPARNNGGKSYQPQGALKSERGAYVVPLGAEVTWVQLALAE
jgi:Family of unknown function (DUF5695)